MQWTVRRGTRGQIVRFFIRRSEDGRGASGLSAETAGVRAASLRQGDSAPSDLILRSAPDTASEASEHVAGLFREISPESTPGLYELHLPDDLLAAGTETVVMVQAPGAEPQALRFDLVAYDPQDGERLGLECLSREGRHAVITRAFREVVPAIIRDFQDEAEGEG